MTFCRWDGHAFAEGYFQVQQLCEQVKCQKPLVQRSKFSIARSRNAVKTFSLKQLKVKRVLTWLIGYNLVLTFQLGFNL